MNPLAERVAHLALSTFNSLPQKCKPRSLPNGNTEWTPMSAVVLAQEGQNPALTCVSLATGTKCLSASSLPRCKGLVVHDSHAEILALRGFNQWMLSELESILRDAAYRSPYLEFSPRNDGGTAEGCPFRIKDNVTTHFFTTEAPCGDASMEILMDSFPSGDATPWEVDSNTATLLQGRGYFSLLGHVRRKPARADAEPSGSKSCTDKLAVKQFTTILSFPTDLFVDKTPNAYIKSVVVYADQYDPVGYQRAFGPEGRLSVLKKTGLFFAIETLPVDFPRFAFQRRAQTSTSSIQPKSKTSNISALWVHGTGTSRQDIVEVLINGVKQGYQQWDVRSAKASVVSRRELWAHGLRINNLLEHLDIAGNPSGIPDQGTSSWLRMTHKTLSASTYEEAESSNLRKSYKECKLRVTDLLGNWTKNAGDTDWSCSQHDQRIHTLLGNERPVKNSKYSFIKEGSV